MRGRDIIGTIYEHTQNDKSHKTYTNNVTRVKLTCLESILHLIIFSKALKKLENVHATVLQKV